MQKKWNFGFGTIFSLIVVYFIFLYSRDHNWEVLAFITKWYLFIFGGLFLLSMALFLFAAIGSLLILVFAYFKMRSMGKSRKKKTKSYVDIDYEVKE